MSLAPAATADVPAAAAVASSSPSAPQKWDAARDLSRFDAIIFDCDGVLWHETRVIPGAPETLQKLKDMGKLLLFATNNSGKSRETYLAKFTQLGFGSLGLTAAHIFTSSQTAAAYMRSLDASSFDRTAHKIYTIGESGIGVELRAAGIQCVEAMQLFGGKHLSKAQLAELTVDPQIRAVVIGIDEELTYTKIAYGVACLARPDCLFISTNQDSTLPTAGHTLPGAGSCVAMLATASGRVPLNMGKPERGMLDLAMAEHNLKHRSRVLMVGDRLDTDILFGIKGQVPSLFVSDTGINNLKDVATTGIVPTFVIGNVNEILSTSKA